MYDYFVWTQQAGHFHPPIEAIYPIPWHQTLHQFFAARIDTHTNRPGENPLSKQYPTHVPLSVELTDRVKHSVLQFALLLPCCCWVRYLNSIQTLLVWHSRG